MPPRELPDLAVDWAGVGGTGRPVVEPEAGGLQCWICRDLDRPVSACSSPPQTLHLETLLSPHSRHVSSWGELVPGEASEGQMRRLCSPRPEVSELA